MLWAGRAHYASDVLPRSSTFEQYGDQIDQCVAAAKKHGLEVHVWKVNYNLSGAPKDFVEKLRREGRLQMTAEGEPHEWLCPSHPENQKLELESMLEVARKVRRRRAALRLHSLPGPTVLLLRRLPRAVRGRLGPQGGRLAEGLLLRLAARGVQRLALPADHPAGGGRASRGEETAAGVSKISAAVFGSYPACRESVAQDWPEWVKAGYLDFVCPMDYTDSDRQFTSLVENQLKLVDGRIPVYPGIGAWRLTHDRVVGQIHHARSLGAAGFTIFNFNSVPPRRSSPASDWAPVDKAVPPHRQ